MSNQVSLCSFTKSVFKLVKGSFKWNQGKNRSVCIQGGSETNGFFSLGCLRIKHSFRCQILRSKECRYADSGNVYFNLVNDLLKLNEG